jgi:peptide/nickel transport system substrate-binding protein
MKPERLNKIEKMAGSVREGQLDRREFMALASIWGMGASAAAGLLGASATPAVAQEAKKGGVLRIGQTVLDINDPRTYDWPQKSNVARQFCEPLVRWNPDGSFGPSLLTSWEVSDDAKTYLLNVRKDAVWNNGDPFTADDVIFNIRRMADATAEGNSMAARMAALRDGDATEAAEGAIEKVDDYTVRLNLFTADISLIPSFGDYPALCVHPSFSGQLQDAAIGTGGFELVEFAIGSRAVLKRREDGKWWGGEVYLDGIEFIDYGSDDTAYVSAFESDEIDMNDETTKNLDELFLSIGLQRGSAITATTLVARMNTQQPPFDNQMLRNAVQMAVDNELALELAAAGQGVPADNHHVAPMHPEYAEVPKPPHDPAKAKEMLDESGHAETELELISIDEGELMAFADTVAAQLRDAGFNISRRTLPGATFWNDWTQYPFSTTSWGARPLGVQVYAIAYKTGAAWNESAHSNPEFDAKLTEALGIFDPEERRVLMADLEKMLQDSGVIVQPYWSELIMHHTDVLKGYERHPAREMHLEKVWLDR